MPRISAPIPTVLGYKDRRRFHDRITPVRGCWEFEGRAVGKGGYRLFGIGGREIYAHRLAYSLAHPQWDQSMDVDHICHNPACVRPEHLRAVSRKQNMENMKQERQSTSGIRGVSWSSATGKWRVQVVHHGEAHHGGLYGNIEKAEAAAVALRNELYTHNDSDNPEREVLRVQAMWRRFGDAVAWYRDEAPEDLSRYSVCANCDRKVWHFAMSTGEYVRAMDRHDELCEAR